MVMKYYGQQKKEKKKDMNFKKYNEIENSYREKFITNINAMLASREIENEFVVLEKVHGANFSFWYDGNELKTAKKSDFVGGDGEDFYNSHLIKAKYSDNVKNLFEHFNRKFGKIDNLVVFGELFGGHYPDAEKKDKSIKMVQKGIAYCPDLEFYAFDIMVDGNYINADDVEYLCRAFDIFHAKILYRGKLEDCLKYPNEFVTLIPKWLGLPDIEGNICEGVVIKPIKNAFFKSGSRVIIKNKNDKWSEREKKAPKEKTVTILSMEANRLLSEALNFATENRLRNVLSKWEGDITSKDFGRLMQLMNLDALEDFNKDFKEDFDKLPKDEQKYINKALGGKNSDIIRKNFLNIIDKIF